MACVSVVSLLAQGPVGTLDDRAFCVAITRRLTRGHDGFGAARSALLKRRFQASGFRLFRRRYSEDRDVIPTGITLSEAGYYGRVTARWMTSRRRCCALVPRIEMLENA